mmetsp:Transcript_582/g.1703  ORF Transcript_582/g.1703 Transcript_582/m.1703 type:complete len:134 (+) Transcript_582:182-583(+)
MSLSLSPFAIQLILSMIIEARKYFYRKICKDFYKRLNCPTSLIRLINVIDISIISLLMPQCRSPPPLCRRRTVYQVQGHHLGEYLYEEAQLVAAVEVNQSPHEAIIASLGLAISARRFLSTGRILSVTTRHFR